jgi:predicted dehydrogenase
MVEKPVTPTVQEAEELAALAKSKNLVICVYQNRRWDADFLTLKKILEADTVRPVQLLHLLIPAWRCARVPHSL